MPKSKAKTKKSQRQGIYWYIKKLEKKNEALIEALSWYADRSNWIRKVNQSSWIKPSSSFDRGSRANFYLTMLDLK